MSAKRNSLTRREFLKVAGTAAFAASAGSVLASCVPAAPAPAAPAAATAAPAAATAVPAVVAPASKEVVLAIQAFAHDALKPVIAEWEQKTGMKVTLESGPTTGQEMMTKYAPAFQSKTSPVDVISVDDVSGPAFSRAGWVLPLDSVIPAETWAGLSRELPAPGGSGSVPQLRGQTLPRAARVCGRLFLASQGLVRREEDRRAQDLG